MMCRVCGEKATFEVKTPYTKYLNKKKEFRVKIEGFCNLHLPLVFKLEHQEG